MKETPPPAPPVGLRHCRSLVIAPELTVPQVSPAFGNFADMPPVFATALMVGFIESTCLDALGPYLAPGQKTVGTQVNVTHSAATPVGMTVTAEVELVEVESRKLTFKVTCRDERDVISEGTHQRVIIDERRFLERLAAKAAGAAV
jgi:fluoroacetyl-CoA thioesterase